MKTACFVLLGIVAAVLILVALILVRSPKQNYRLTDLITQGVRLSDGSIALFLAKPYGDRWGASFAELAVLDQQDDSLSHYPFSGQLLRNTDVVFEVAQSREVVQVRFPGQNAGVRWSVSTKAFDPEHISSDGSCIPVLELRGVTWNGNAESGVSSATGPRR